MVVLPPGRFTMGSPDDEAERDGDEGPRHEVTIGAPLAVGRFAITRGEFARFAVDNSGAGNSGAGNSGAGNSGAGNSGPGSGGAGGCFTLSADAIWAQQPAAGWQAPGFPQDDRHPVVCIGFDEALAYTRWLSARTGKPYRLLSEAEFEYAARAGTDTRYWWGNDPDHTQQCRFANGPDAAVKEAYPAWSWTVTACRDGHVQTAPAGAFPPNAFGLHDMSGNVWQWTADCYRGDYTNAAFDGSPWRDDACNLRVLRGGSWGVPGDLRTAFRSGFVPGMRASDFGFRVARDLGP
jgi:formylglycine-generating enzyme required for sulfatase activity